MCDKILTDVFDIKTFSIFGGNIKMYKKILCAMLAATIGAAALSGCSVNFNKTNSGNNSSETSSVAPSEPKDSDASQSESSEPVNSKAESQITAKPAAQWNDYRFTIDGEELTFPFNFSKLIDMGWYVSLEEDTEIDTVDANSEIVSLFLSNDKYTGVTMLTSVANYSDKKCNIEDAKVNFIEIDTANAEGDLPDITLAGGVKWGATVDEIVAVFGKPDDNPSEYESKYFDNLYYTDSDSNKMELYVSKTDGLSGIYLMPFDVDGGADETGSNTESKTSSKDETSKTSSKSASDAKISDDWRNFQFKFDGKAYTMLFDYKDLKDSGWTFDLADYGYSDGYTLNGGDKVSATIDLENDDYDAQVWIGMANLNSTACDITEGQVWAFECDTSFADGELPELELPGGITWGSTKEEIISAYGEPESEPYYSKELGYYSYEYETEDANKFGLIIYDDGGLKQFDYHIYNTDKAI